MTALRHLVLVLGFLASVFGAYWVSNRAKDADDRIVELRAQIQQEEKRIAALRADWAYLNRGDRLVHLVGAHSEALGLGPVSPDRLASLGTVSKRESRHE